MTHRSTYRGRYSGMGKLLQRPGIQRACRKAAVRIMEEAQAVSPTGDPTEDRHPGLFRASFDVVPLWKNIPFRGKPRMRAGATVINAAPHAWRVEHGDGRVQRYAPLRKAIDALKAAHGA